MREARNVLYLFKAPQSIPNQDIPSDRDIWNDQPEDGEIPTTSY